ncbi:dienelactone hydrolase family protein [Nisaea acidiphila]|uniref:Dienelactone hydrolase family protein n=1 Tax=Nisaea acidiphila TaxID=1862145 RepID=A0A9J7AJT6_9PROT|nr:dienelactone hydrolase family protein [Nisaea acidiphila]UUX47939.1 dienelactone hydrolase family protein [Nisaea acidiphila]
MSYVTVTAADGGSFQAYHAAPPGGGKAPGIVLIQEIFGVNKVMRDQADAYAALGYHVLCPDIFWRIEPGIDITDQSQAEWDKAFELFNAFDVDKGVEDLKATLAQLKSMEGCSGKAGSVGYCLGGKLAYLMATRSDADCNVSYYGVGLDELLSESSNISMPYISHIASEDGFVPKEAQEKIKAGLSGNPLVTLHVYEGQDHAFARQGGAHYDDPSAKLANGRTAGFFKANLG